MLKRTCIGAWLLASLGAGVAAGGCFADPVARPSDGGASGHSEDAASDTQGAPPTDAREGPDGDAQSHDATTVAPDATVDATTVAPDATVDATTVAPDATVDATTADGSTMPPGSSCTASGDGLTNCGAGAESCCTSPLVTGGTFSRSYDGVIYKEPQYRATVADFRLDKYEVTVGRFRRFVDAVVAGWLPAAGSGKHTHLNGGNGLAASVGFEPGWDVAGNANLPVLKALWDSTTHLGCDPGNGTWTPGVGANEKRPINCATWYQASAFCIWDGGFLPSEAEWNYAASGGSEQRVYPWSSPPTSTTESAAHAVYWPGFGPFLGTQDVGSKATAGTGRYGQVDLAGNVWEWVADFEQSYYRETMCTNCVNDVASAGRVFRGGSFGGNASSMLTSSRLGGAPTRVDGAIGFRCARTP